MTVKGGALMVLHYRGFVIRIYTSQPTIGGELISKEHSYSGYIMKGYNIFGEATHKKKSIVITDLKKQIDVLLRVK